MEEKPEVKESLEQLKKKTLEEMKVLRKEYDNSIEPHKQILERAKISYERKIKYHKQIKQKQLNKLFDKTIEQYYNILSENKIYKDPVDSYWFFKE
jgi:hypothetical protein